MQGFWTAHFTTPLGAGSGVAYITDDAIYGGDGGYTYTGAYQIISGNLDARLQIAPIAGASTPSVFGSVGKAFPLQLTGRTNGGNAIECVGASQNFPGVSFKVTLKRVQ